ASGHLDPIRHDAGAGPERRDGDDRRAHPLGRHEDRAKSADPGRYTDSQLSVPAQDHLEAEGGSHDLHHPALDRVVGREKVWIRVSHAPGCWSSTTRRTSFEFSSSVSNRSGITWRRPPTGRKP